MNSRIILVTEGIAMSQFLSMGLIGFVIVLIANLVARMQFGQADAAFFSDGWWSTWFVNYLVWLVFAIIGFGQQLAGKSPPKN